MTQCQLPVCGGSDRTSSRCSTSARCSSGIGCALSSSFLNSIRNGIPTPTTDSDPTKLNTRTVCSGSGMVVKVLVVIAFWPSAPTAVRVAT